MLDVNMDGVLSEHELHEGLCNRGWEQDELQGLFQELDANGDGVVTLDEYLNGMTKRHALEWWRKLEFTLAWIASKEARYQAGLARFTLDRRENIDALKEQWDSVVHDRAPMMVVPYQEFKELRRLPRSSDRIYVPLDDMKVTLFFVRTTGCG